MAGFASKEHLRYSVCLLLGVRPSSATLYMSKTFCGWLGGQKTGQFLVDHHLLAGTLGKEYWTEVGLGFILITPYVL